jgi:hypothetical protein
LVGAEEAPFGGHPGVGIGDVWVRENRAVVKGVGNFAGPLA